MSWVLCSSQSAIARAGVYANSDITSSGSRLSEWSDEAEAEISGALRYDISSNYSSLTTAGVKVFQRLASCMIAQNIITYDTSGYERRLDAELTLDFLDNQIQKDLKFVSDNNNKAYLGVV